MPGEKVLYEADERGVATLTLNDPDTRNALSAELLVELTAALQRARDEDRIEVGDIEPKELGARVGDFVFEPAAVRSDDHAMAGAAQNAHEIDCACIRRTRMQRRREHEHGERSRKRDDFANSFLRCDRNFDIRVRVERTARVSSRIQDRPHRPGAAAFTPNRQHL